MENQIIYALWDVASNRWLLADSGRVFQTNDRGVAEKARSQFPPNVEVREFDPLRAQDLFVASMAKVPHDISFPTNESLLKDKK